MEAATQTSKKGSREVKFKLQQRPQDVGDVSNVGASAEDSCQPQSKAMWAVPGKAVVGAEQA